MKVLKTEHFLKDLSFGSIIVLKFVALCMQVPSTPVPYIKRQNMHATSKSYS